MSRRALQLPPGPPSPAWLSEDPSRDGFERDVRAPRPQPCPVPSISYLLQGFPSPLCLISTYSSCLFSCPFLASPCPKDKCFPCFQMSPPAPSSPTSALPWGWDPVPHPPPTAEHRGQAGPPQRWPGPPLRSGAGGGRPCRPRCTGTYCQQSQFKPPPAAVAVSKCQDSLRGSESCSHRESLTMQELWLVARAGATIAGCRRNLGQSVRPYPYPLPEPREALSRGPAAPRSDPVPTTCWAHGCP